MDGYDGKEYDYTNSYEALINMYGLGNRVAEVDFSFTDDWELVCAHDFSTWDGETEVVDCITGKDFSGGKIYSEFTPLTFSELADFMRNNPDLYIITDVKEFNLLACERISEIAPDLKDRFIIQIYHSEEYEPVRLLGFPYIIWTLYMTAGPEWDIQVIKDAFIRYDLLGVTMREDWADGTADFTGWSDDPGWIHGTELFDSMVNMNVPVYVYTVNDKKKIQDLIYYGVDAIYTDNTDNIWLRKL
ncbi:MAG: hypothetical protein IJ058_13750 [Lachnospiraceae bacterium]|nr:hypothetical protein [Lachnospiraceae bacterium]MBQ8947844.1 hypothetical protein [Lachnospiraceae bacterium]